MTSPLAKRMRSPGDVIEADVRRVLLNLFDGEQSSHPERAASDRLLFRAAGNAPLAGSRNANANGAGAAPGRDLQTRSRAGEETPLQAATAHGRVGGAAATGPAPATALEKAQLLGAFLKQTSDGNAATLAPLTRDGPPPEPHSVGSSLRIGPPRLAPSQADSAARAADYRRLAASPQVGAAPRGEIAAAVTAPAPGTGAGAGDTEDSDRDIEWVNVPRRPAQARLVRTDTRSNGDEWVLDPNREGSEGFSGFVTVPRPRGAARVLNDNTRGFHRYHYEDELPGAERLPEWVLREILRRNAAPNDMLKPASRRGANNDAAFPVPFNQIVSYERDSNAGQYWVVNVTRSLTGRSGSGAAFEPGMHFLSHGWVASTLRRNPNGTLSLLTYGEGNSPVQDPDTPLGRSFGDWMNDYVWDMRADHMQRDIENAVRGGPRYWERYRRQAPRDIRRDENGNFILR